jgi:hypothetical protein
LNIFHGFCGEIGTIIIDAGKDLTVLKIQSLISFDTMGIMTVYVVKCSSLDGDRGPCPVQMLGLLFDQSVEAW